MSQKGKLLKIYLNENATIKEKHRFVSRNLYHAIVQKLHDSGIRGATVIRGIEGYGGDGFIHTTNIVDLSFDLPIIIEVVDTEEKIDAVLPEIKAMVKKGVILTIPVEMI